MAYVECVRCGLTAYTAAYWSSIDSCARCDTPLPKRATGVAPIVRATGGRDEQPDAR